MEKVVDEVVVEVVVEVEVEPMQDWQLVLLPIFPGHQHLLKMATKMVAEWFPAALQ